MDGSALLVWPEDRAGWSRLTRLLTVGKSRADRKKGEKGQCFLHWEDVAAWAEGLVAALVPGRGRCGGRRPRWPRVRDIFGDRAHLALTHRRRPGDAARLHALDALARRLGVRSLATGDVLYNSPDKRMLQDVVTAIRDKCTIDELGFRRERFADRHLKSAGGDGAPLRRLSRRDPRPAPTWPRAAPSRLREIELPISRRDRHGGPHPQQALERLTRAALAAQIPGRAARGLSPACSTTSCGWSGSSATRPIS